MSIGKTTQKQNFKIAVLESSRITASLQRTTHNKKIEIKEYKFLKEIHSCQILFIPYNSSIPIEKILYYFPVSLY
jgi:D-mannonate dehydratase